MSSPQKNVSNILRNYPEGADALYDIILWANSSRGIVEQLEVDEVMSELYGKTSDGNKHRKDHDEKFLRVKRRNTVEDAVTDLLPA